MTLKIIKAFWFLSLIVWLALFLYVYASLPADVLLRDGLEQILISRNALFYSFLGVVAFINGLVFAISRLYAREESFMTWFYGMIICLNFFFVIVMNFINVINSGEKFDYSRLGYIIYGSLTLFIFWAVGWPVYRLFRRLFSKEAV